MKNEKRGKNNIKNEIDKKDYSKPKAKVQSENEI